MLSRRGELQHRAGEALAGSGVLAIESPDPRTTREPTPVHPENFRPDGSFASVSTKQFHLQKLLRRGTSQRMSQRLPVRIVRGEELPRRKANKRPLRLPTSFEPLHRC